MNKALLINKIDKYDVKIGAYNNVECIYPKYVISMDKINQSRRYYL